MGGNRRWRFAVVVQSRECGDITNMNDGLYSVPPPTRLSADPVCMEVVQLSPRMGQQHHSPGQSGATERREAPPWVLQSAKRCPEGAYQNAGAIIACSFGPFRAIYGVFVAYPGRRCALPWAKLLKPVGLNSKETQLADDLSSFSP